MRFTKKDIGKIIVMAGKGFLLYKTDDIKRYFGKEIYNINLRRQRVTIVGTDMIQLKNGDILKL
jgi:hypothetical protein